VLKGSQEVKFNVKQHTSYVVRKEFFARLYISEQASLSYSCRPQLWGRKAETKLHVALCVHKSVKNDNRNTKAVHLTVLKI